MGKLAIDARGLIERNLIWMSRRERVKDVVNYVAISEESLQARQLQEAITSGRTLRELDLSRAWFVVAQNQLSALAEQTGAPPQRHGFINEDGSRR